MIPQSLLLSLAACALLSSCATELRSSTLRMPKTDLDEFFLPRVSVNNLPLDEALEQIRLQYDDISRQSGGSDQKLVFRLVDKPDHRVTGHFTNVAASQVISHLSAQAGLMATLKRGSVTLERIPGADQPNSSGTFRVPPSIIKDLEQRTGSDRPRPAEEADLLRFFRQQGALVSPSAEVDYDHAKGMITLRSTLHDQLRLGLFFTTGRTSHRMLKLETTRATFARDPQFPVGTMSTKKAKSWLSRAEKAGAVIQRLPSVTTRLDKSARMELLRQWSTSRAKSWLGTRCHFHLNTYGSSNEARISYERRLFWTGTKELPMVVGDDLTGSGSGNFRQSDELNRALSETITPGTVEYRDQKSLFAEFLAPGEIHIRKCSGSSSSTEYLLVKVVRINAG